MEFIAIKTANGLKPSFDDDYESYSKLKVGDTFKVKVTKQRNLQFHKKYFALINCAWSFQNHATTTHFKESIHNFRKTIEISAGHCETVYSISLKQWIDIPKSISFDKMDETEFSILYENVKNVLFSVFLTKINQQDFENALINF